jgi:hypothetical protein
LRIDLVRPDRPLLHPEAPRRANTAMVNARIEDEREELGKVVS